MVHLFWLLKCRVYFKAPVLGSGFSFVGVCGLCFRGFAECISKSTEVNSTSFSHIQVYMDHLLAATKKASCFTTNTDSLPFCKTSCGNLLLCLKKQQHFYENPAIKSWISQPVLLSDCDNVRENIQTYCLVPSHMLVEWSLSLLTVDIPKWMSDYLITTKNVTFSELCSRVQLVLKAGVCFVLFFITKNPKWF